MRKLRITVLAAAAALLLTPATASAANMPDWMADFGSMVDAFEASGGGGGGPGPSRLHPGTYFQPGPVATLPASPQPGEASTPPQPSRPISERVRCSGGGTPIITESGGIITVRCPPGQQVIISIP
jgi:hypothetical protein